MIILNPLEPWPGSLCLPAAAKAGTKVITRVVDYGGLFHDDVKPGHQFAPRDHRTFRPAGGSGAAESKRCARSPMHTISRCCSLPAFGTFSIPVESVVPTLIQEPGAAAKRIEAKVDELATLPDVTLTRKEYAQIAEIGDNNLDQPQRRERHAHRRSPAGSLAA